jgi:signal transduction histidine kinase
MANQMCAQAQLRCRLEVPDLPIEVSVSSLIRHNLTMVVKEAIHNTVKHAKATEIRIKIWFEDQVLYIDVFDNGKGFNPTAKLRGNGLGNMQRRLRATGGRLAIESSPGAGTKVHLELPLPSH